MRLHHRSFLCTAVASLLAIGALLALATRARADVPNPVRSAGGVRFEVKNYVQTPIDSSTCGDS